MLFLKLNNQSLLDQCHFQDPLWIPIDHFLSSVQLNIIFSLPGDGNTFIYNVKGPSYFIVESRQTSVIIHCGYDTNVHVFFSPLFPQQPIL